MSNSISVTAYIDEGRQIKSDALLKNYVNDSKNVERVSFRTDSGTVIPYDQVPPGSTLKVRGAKGEIGDVTSGSNGALRAK